MHHYARPSQELTKEHEQQTHHADSSTRSSGCNIGALTPMPWPAHVLLGIKCPTAFNDGPHPGLTAHVLESPQRAAFRALAAASALYDDTVRPA
eukprot:scaffold134596_cov34-Tisochrysis_lutea.AAC.1